jgi:hypothetical protein
MTTLRDPDTGVRLRNCPCVTCYYCDVLLAPRHEHDHFPVPASLRGKDTVPACINCHEWKDRTPLSVWPMGLHCDGLQTVLGTVDAAAMGVCPEPAALLDAVGDYQRFWPSWSMEARLYYAKVTVIAARAELRCRIDLARTSLARPGSNPDAVADAVGIERHIAKQIADAATERHGDLDLWPGVVDRDRAARYAASLPLPAEAATAPSWVRSELW